MAKSEVHRMQPLKSLDLYGNKSFIKNMTVHQLVSQFSNNAWYSVQPGLDPKKKMNDLNPNRQKIRAGQIATTLRTISCKYLTTKLLLAAGFWLIALS